MFEPGKFYKSKDWTIFVEEIQPKRDDLAQHLNVYGIATVERKKYRPVWIDENDFDSYTEISKSEWMQDGSDNPPQGEKETK